MLRLPRGEPQVGQHRPAPCSCTRPTRALRARVTCQATAAAGATTAWPSQQQHMPVVLGMRAPGAARPSAAAPPVAAPAELSCELLQGNIARFSTAYAGSGSVPTAVLVHGILGSRRNLHSFARMLVEGFPSWQVLLVDLRCHGESAAANGGAPAAGPHTVEAAARDVLELLRRRRMFPHMLVGHSFGGKVVMSMARQFGAAALPRPVQVWALDAPPGPTRGGGGARGAPGSAAGADSPAALISALEQLPLPAASRADVIDHLVGRGFSLQIARWMTTNLKPGPGGKGLVWSFDLEGISQMYESYESSSLWELLRAPPQGLRVDFVKAARGAFSWGEGAEAAIAALGHGVHHLDAGHWVHSDNPSGLFDILAPSFGAVDLHMQRSSWRAA